MDGLCPEAQPRCHNRRGHGKWLWATLRLSVTAQPMTLL
jgi:hypothetical protein